MFVYKAISLYFMLISFSLEFAVGEADENDWRDTVQLHSEKVT